MSQKEKMKDDFIKIIDGYYMQLVYLKDLMDVQEDIESHNEKLKCAPNFFLIAECGLIDSYMMVFAKLFDKSEDTMTISYLLKKCKNNINLFSDANLVTKKIESFKEKLEKDEFISNGVKIIRQRRDTIVAHNDKKYFGEKMKDDASYLPKYYLWMMRDFVNEVLDFISSQLGIKSIHSYTKYDKDLNNLFTSKETIKI